MSIKNILIVEDSRLMNQAMHDRLSKHNFNCFSAYDLKSAHNIYDDENIDLIILDLHLPDGEGEDFILALKEKEKNKEEKTKIIVFTSSGDLSRRDELFRLGIVDYLNKGKHADIVFRDTLTIINNIDKNSAFCILIVDDSAVVRLMMRTLLIPQNYNILGAKSADEATEVLNKNNVDLILLDLEMHGISGMDFLQTLKENSEYATLPVLIISSHSDVSIVRDVYKNGASDFFKKPFAPEEFILKIQQQINHKEVLEQRDKLSKAYKEYKSILLTSSIYATFTKSGRVDFYNDNFKRYFIDVDTNIQKMFSPYFDSSYIKNILNVQRSKEVYQGVIQDKSGREFYVKCFTSSIEHPKELFHIVLS